MSNVIIVHFILSNGLSACGRSVDFPSKRTFNPSVVSCKVCAGIVKRFNIGC